MSQPIKYDNTVKPLFSSHPRGCTKSGLAEVNIGTKSKKLKFGNILFGCLIKVTVKSGLTVLEHVNLINVKMI